jgi:hypothetical protein
VQTTWYKSSTVRRSTTNQEDQKSSLLRQMDGAIKRCLGSGDFVKIRDASQHRPEGTLLFGEVVAAVNEDGLRCWIYSLMTSSILNQFSLPQITVSMFPVAARTVVTEVVATSTFEIITRDEAEEVVFIVPIRELESGNLFITGAMNLYFVCNLVDKTTVINYSSNEFFGYHLIQPSPFIFSVH